ncbi:MAG: hypothetical protein H8E79_02185 [Desulfobulbaceae bacterium]|uniref:UDP-glucose/GDP-mannose dehydrogenase N-terminal domain-containing protein n=1 Tax=Candidatus Desulfatifera sulfidica TaxID=2841691 RepID=A0A8J6N9F9_9BACT|nr:hypothetical protein [Candidatus Desulfatifera sulfidica]
MYLTTLKNKISDKSLTVGIIGLGYVGLPLAVAFLRKGIRVIGFDVDQNKIDVLARGKSYIKHVSGDELAGYGETGLFVSDF